MMPPMIQMYEPDGRKRRSAVMGVEMPTNRNTILSSGGNRVNIRMYFCMALPYVSI